MAMAISKELENCINDITKKILGKDSVEKSLDYFKKWIEDSYDFDDDPKCIVVKQKNGVREGIGFKKNWEEEFKNKVKSINKVPKLKLLSGGAYNYFVKHVGKKEKEKGCIKGESLFNSIFITYKEEDCSEEIKGLIESFCSKVDIEAFYKDGGYYDLLSDDVKEAVTEAIFRPLMDEINKAIIPIGKVMLTDILDDKTKYDEFVSKFGLFGSIV